MIGGTELKVGIGDMKFSRGEGRIITYALGSCIGITFYDPVTRLGALLHIMLPAQFEGKDSNPFKFADSGIRETLRKLKIFGMVKSRMVVKIAGGAKMFEISGNSSFGNIGAEKCRKCKKSHGPGRNLYRSRGYRRKLCPYHAFRSCNRRCDRAYSGTTGTPSIARAFIYGGVIICDMPVYRKKERRSWSKMKKKGFF